VGRILGENGKDGETSTQENIRQIFSYDEMNTVLVEVERVINSRPITYIYDDREATCIGYALTPSHLINGRSISTIPSMQSTSRCNKYKSNPHKKIAPSPTLTTTISAKMETRLPFEFT
jgi:hypothetical protein